MKHIILKWFYQVIPSHIDTEYHEVLCKHSTYYNRLHPELKSRFRLRLFHLLNVLAFSSSYCRPVTREMRAVMGGAIIEITFGLDRYIPSRFLEVRVMPRKYMYPGYGQPFLGHVDYHRNMIFLSWEDVQKGYWVPDDAKNVALHEMAHVLELETRYSFLFKRFFDAFSWNQWARTAFEKMKIIRKNQHYFLKSYGGINMSEMFSVCIETFFEQPAEFQAHLPEMYATLVNLLQQDPLLQENPLSWRDERTGF